MLKDPTVFRHSNASDSSVVHLGGGVCVNVWSTFEHKGAKLNSTGRGIRGGPFIGCLHLR